MSETEKQQADGEASGASTCSPCPFCGDIPAFKGEALERDDRRYYVYLLPCGCHDMEIIGNDVEDVQKNWNESFEANVQTEAR